MITKYEWKIPDIALLDEKKAKAIIAKSNNVFLDSALSTYQSNIILEAPVGATTQLKNNILQKKISSTKGVVISAAKYSSVVQGGRKPAPVSRSADRSLEAWVKRSKAGRSFFAGLKTAYPKITVAQAVFLLKRSKKKKATKPNPFFTRGINKSVPTVNRLFNGFSQRLSKDLMR